MKIIKRGTHKGFDYAVALHAFGHRCGYVKLPQDHPWFGKYYDELNEYITIHGGLTFSEHIKDDEHPAGNGFWIGFDCAHCFDAYDPDEMDQEVLRDLGKFFAAMNKSSNGKIRNNGYVESQCKNLAQDCFEVKLLCELENSLTNKTEEENDRDSIDINNGNV